MDFDPNEHDAQAWQALHHAIAANDLRAVKAALKEKIHPDRWDFDRGYPLTGAIKLHNTAVAKALLQAGANPNFTDYMRDCIKRGDTRFAKLLITHGVDLDGQPTWEKDDDFETSLMLAIRKRRYVIAKALLEAGADANRRDGHDESAYYSARLSKDKKALTLLEPYVSVEHRTWVEEVQSDRERGKRELDNEISDAILRGQTDRVRQLIAEQGRNVQDFLRNGDGSLLQHAINTYYGTQDETRPIIWEEPDVVVPTERALNTIRLLLDLGAPADAVWYRCGLHCASGRFSEGHPDLFERMIRSVDDIDVQQAMTQSTALHYAVFWRGINATRLLLAYGANVNAKDEYDWTVLDVAQGRERFHGPNPCVPILLEAGAAPSDNKKPR